jgi:acetyl esterase/lipase
MAVYEHLLKTEDPKRLVVVGDSAGGNLTAMLCVRARDAGMPLPAAAALISPWVDLSERSVEDDPDDWLTGVWGDSFRDAYLGAHLHDDPGASPLYAKLHGLPPMLIQAGTAELLYGQIEKFVSRLQEAGVDVVFEPAPGMVHVWHFLANVYKPARDAIDSVGRFIRSRANARSRLDLG